MVYKSKKTNRKRYLQTRKMYGGVPNPNPNPDPNKYNIPPSTINPPPTPSKNEVYVEPPTMTKNLTEVGNLVASAVTNVVADGIDKLSESVGLDPNKSASDSIKVVSDNIENVVDALNSPEGAKLKQEASSLLTESLEIAKPSIEKAEQIAEEGIKNVSKNVASFAGNALQEALPPLFLANELSRLGSAGAGALTAIAKLTEDGAEASKNLEGQEDKAKSLLSNLKNVLNKISSGINNEVASGINYGKEKVDKYGQQVATHTSPVQYGGGSLNKYRKEAKMVGGRVAASQLEFLSSHVNQSQIIRQSSRKRKTRNYKRGKQRLTSRRH